MRILIVEDEKKTAAYLQKGLAENGFTVDLADCGEDGLHLPRSESRITSYKVCYTTLLRSWKARASRSATSGAERPTSWPSTPAELPAETEWGR